MNISREYIKLLNPAVRKALAEKAGVSSDFLYQIGRGDRVPSRHLAVSLEELTSGCFRSSDFDEEIRTNIKEGGN